MKQVCLFSHFYATVVCAAELAVPIEVEAVVTIVSVLEVHLPKN